MREIMPRSYDKVMHINDCIVVPLSIARRGSNHIGLTDKIT